MTMLKKKKNNMKIEYRPLRGKHNFSFKKKIEMRKLSIIRTLCFENTPAENKYTGANNKLIKMSSYYSASGNRIYIVLYGENFILVR